MTQRSLQNLTLAWPSDRPWKAENPSLKQATNASPTKLNHPCCNAILPISGLSDQHPTAYPEQGSSTGSFFVPPFTGLFLLGFHPRLVNTDSSGLETVWDVISDSEYAAFHCALYEFLIHHMRQHRFC